MKKAIAISVIVVLCGIFIWNVFSSRDEEKVVTTGIEVGSEAPDFHLQTLEGDAVTLHEKRGKTVVVNFWATWCPPCKEETPDFVSFAQAHPEVEMLSVNLTSTEKSTKDVRAFLKKYDVPYTTVLDTMDKANKLYEVTTIPTTYVIDDKGIIRKVFAGAVSEKDLTQIVNKISEG